VEKMSLETEGICPIRSKAEDWSHILRCEGAKIWRRQILDKRCRNIDPEIGIRRTVGCKNKEQWEKIGVCMIKRIEKWKMMVIYAKRRGY
jgi:hypothetical protein